ncbi:hypothetical protein [Vibrio algivorus]|uniref:Uncharacterized protein n=1 Tax=Vibrio algivorus TaxID=1667024 RepID=A0A557PFI7_9VIBR|nr:hypothetical protein [Vibrio algivorus]TVO39427.1 hypothetical protein FOF44_02240 [Vibrio algivorus]
MSERNTYHPRKPKGGELVSEAMPFASQMNVSKERKEVDKRPNPIERYLDKFKFTNEKHIAWLKKEAVFYQIKHDAYSQLRDVDFRFCVEIADWFKREEGQKEIDEIRQKWAKYYSPSKKINYSVAMPKLIYSHLQALAKDSAISMNAVVFNLIEQAYIDKQNGSSFEEDVRNRFDELEKLILSSQKNNEVNDFQVSISEQNMACSLEDKIISLTAELKEAKDCNISIESIAALSSSAQSFKSHLEKRRKK